MPFRKSWATAFALLLLLMCASGISHAATGTRDYWQDVPARALPTGVSAPSAYRLLDLDASGLKARILQGETKLSLPSPDGSFVEFTLEDSGTMPAELAAKFPEIRSFRGKDDSGAHVRVDVSPLGINAMVFAKSRVWLVRPVVFGENRDYISFNRGDMPALADPFQCEVHDLDPARPTVPDEVLTITGTTKRNYSAAVAANHNYVQAISGANPPTVAIGLAGVIAAVNRVNEIYENDFSIHLTLVANNNLLIFPDAGTDPYSNGTGALNQNTGIINGLIGNANYDIGHVFTTGSGGVAGLGVVCSTTQKGRGTTGLSSPSDLQSDTFYVDFVAHEMGHQFGGNHTFNNSCGGNRSAGAAYEPGSGSTIMGYAGVCPVDLQPHSDPYFHAKSLAEIGAFVSGSGGTCSDTAANNTSPVVAPMVNYTIPARTPFVLTGSASSAAPGAALQYGFEQYDLGAATVNMAVDPGNGPIIRSLNPTTSPIRTVPNFAKLLSGATTIGEILPTTTRALNFRLTAFDNVLGGGTTGSNDLTLQVSAAAGPFAVTAPTTGATWNYSNGTGAEAVTWNVAGTTAAPVSCANVDIDIYSSGGFESSLAPLALNVPNNGSAIVNVPNVATTTGRVRVRCSNNIFFAMSPGNFTILGSDLIFADGFEFGVIPSIPPTIVKAFSPTSVDTGVPSTLTITLANTNATAATLTSALTDTFPANLVVAPTPNAATTCVGGLATASPGSSSVSLSSGAQIPATGNCTVTVSVQSATANSYANTIAIGSLQTDKGSNATSANATLTVNSVALVPPSLTKAFAPTSVNTGTLSTLTITLVNTNATAAMLSSALTDTFPGGLVVAPTPSAATTCPSGTVTANAGTGSVSLSSGAQIPASGSCTVVVDVTSATPNTYANTIAVGALATNAGSNAAAANASLTVTPVVVAQCPTGSNVEVKATAGTAGPTGYPTLKDAFDAINLGTHQGVLNVAVCGDTTETASAVLNASGAGSAAYTSIGIVPSNGGSRTIGGALAAPLIDLNGADNVTIDGLNSGGNALTLSNASAVSTVGTSTIRFVEGASSNTVTRTAILGSSTGTVGVATGNVLFSTSSIAGGNSSNTVSSNNIGPVGSNLPTKGVMGLGTAANPNTGNVINGNNIADFFNPTVGVSGISLQANNNNWTLSNNRLYQTASRTFTGTGLRYAGITLNASTGAFAVTGNTIGFGAANGTGTTTISGSTNTFRGIDAASTSLTVATSIQGNVISGINQSTAATGTTTTTGFVGIMAGSTDGLITIGNVSGNSVGSLDGSSTIVINASAGANTVNGIYNFSNQAANVSNNAIGSITIQGSGTTVGFRGILINTSNAATATATVANNTIANITDSQVGGNSVYGIQTLLPPVAMSGNVVRNLVGNGNAASVVMSGIAVAAGTALAASTISGNQVHSLSDTVSGGAVGAVYAIDLTLPTQANIVERNLVHSISVASTSTAYQVFGLLLRGGATAPSTTTVKNNMIRLGFDAAGVAMTTPFSIIGIRDSLGTNVANSYYHNSVYIGGSNVAAGGSNSYAFFSDTVTTVRNFQNNIFWNARSNAVSGGTAQVAIRLGGTAPNPAGLTSNYNLLLADGNDGVTGVFNALVALTLADWQIATGQDANSFASNPQFIAPNGDAATGNLHISPTNPTHVEGTGLAIGSVTDDYDGDARASFTPTDIGADAGNFVFTP